EFTANGTVHNSGTIWGTEYGVNLLAGGLIDNAASGYIYGAHFPGYLHLPFGASYVIVTPPPAAMVLRSGTTLHNSGTVGPGVEVEGGTVINDGTIVSLWSGTTLNVINSGMVGETQRVPIKAFGDGTITNLAGGHIFSILGRNGLSDDLTII